MFTVNETYMSETEMRPRHFKKGLETVSRPRSRDPELLGHGNMGLAFRIMHVANIYTT